MRKVKKVFKKILRLKLFTFLQKIIRWYHDCYLPDILFVSYPKAGRTWIRTMLGKILSDQYNHSISLNIFDLTKKIEEYSTLRFTHVNPFLKSRINKKIMLFLNKILFFKNKKMILLIRDPRDIVISSFFHYTERENRYIGKIPEFIRDSKYGIKKIVDYYNYWHNNKETFKDFLLVKYENLHNNPRKEVLRILKFARFYPIKEEIIKNAIKFGSFSNMRKIEKEDQLNDWRLRTNNLDNINSYKVRRGIIGGYVEYLSKKDIKFVNKAIKNLLPFFGYN